MARKAVRPKSKASSKTKSTASSRVKSSRNVTARTASKREQEQGRDVQIRGEAGHAPQTAADRALLLADTEWLEGLDHAGGMPAPFILRSRSTSRPVTSSGRTSWRSPE